MSPAAPPFDSDRPSLPPQNVMLPHRTEKFRRRNKTRLPRSGEKTDARGIQKRGEACGERIGPSVRGRWRRTTLRRAIDIGRTQPILNPQEQREYHVFSSIYRGGQSGQRRQRVPVLGANIAGLKLSLAFRHSGRPARQYCPMQQIKNAQST